MRAKPFDVGDDVLVFAQHQELARIVRLSGVVGHGDRAKRVNGREKFTPYVVDGLHVVRDGELAGCVEPGLDHVTLRRRDEHTLDPLLPLELADVGAHHLHPCVTKNHVVGTGVRDVREQEPDNLTSFDAQVIIWLAVEQEEVAESSHETEVAGFLAERHDLFPIHEEIVEYQDFFSIDRIVIVGIRRLDEHVPIQAQLLLDVLPNVRMIPINTGIRKMNLIDEAPAG